MIGWLAVAWAGGAGQIGGIAGIAVGGRYDPPPPLAALPAAAIVGRLGDTRFRAYDRTGVVAIGPDGTVLSGDREGVARFSADGALLGTERGSYVQAVSFDADGTAWWFDDDFRSATTVERAPCRARAAARTRAGTVWGCDDGLYVGERRIADGETDRVAADPDGTVAAAWRSYGGEGLALVDPRAGRVIATFPGVPAGASCAAGTCVASFPDGLVRLAGKRDRERVAAGAFHAVAAGPDGRWAAAEEGAVRIGDCRLPVGAAVRDLAFSPDGGRLAVGLFDQPLALAQVAGCRWERAPDGVPEVVAATPVPEGWLVVGDPLAAVVDRQGNVLRSAPVPVAEPGSFAFDGEAVQWANRRLEGPPVPVGLDPIAALRALDALDYAFEPLVSIGGPLPKEEPVAVSPDGTAWARGVERLLFGRVGERAPQPYDLAAQVDPARRPEAAAVNAPRPAPRPPAPRPEAPAHAGEIAGILAGSELLRTIGEVPAPSVSELVFDSAGYDLLGGTRGIRRFGGLTLRALALSDRGARVAFRFDREWVRGDGSDETDDYAGVLDPGAGTYRELSPAPILGPLAISRDGTRVFGPVSYHQLAVWDAATGEPLGDRVEDPRGDLEDLAVSDDGRFLAAGGDGLAVYRVDPAGLVPITEVDTGQSGVVDLAFRGTELAVVGRDGSVVWVDVGRL